MKTESTGEPTMYLQHRFLQLVGAVFTVLLLSACDTDKPTTLQDSIVTVGPVSDYDLAASVIPFPNDLLFDGSTDGTVNIPVADENDLSDPQVAINGVDGFSTVAPISTGFSRAIDPASISGTSVRVFEVVKSGGTPPIPQASPVTSVTRQLIFGVDYVATVSSVDPTGSTLVVVPLKPLAPKTSYAVMVADALRGTDGKPVAVSVSYLLTSGSAPIFDTTVLAVVSPPFETQDFLDAINSGAVTVEQLTDAILAGVLKPDEGATDEEVADAAATAVSLEGLRAAIVEPSETTLLADAGNSDITSDNVILHWSFTTQSTTDVLAATRAQNRGLTAASGFLPTPVTSSPLGAADIHVGSLQVPYYLTVSDTSSNPSSDPTALGSFWKDGSGGNLSYLLANITPASTSTESIPMLVSIPKTPAPCSAMPSGGWPVVIFQHGITRTRADMLAVADSLALACMAVVAIDMPMHGITGNETDGSAALKDSANGERTFDLDLVTQDADGNVIAQTPDGVIDSSGLHYINLTNLLNTRDNLRQSVSDLFAVEWAIESGVVTDGSNIMDANRIYFLGHSLGAIVGTTFLGREDPAKVRDAALAFGGIGVAKIIDGSATFGPTIRAGLAANGIEKGTPDYESFIGAAQTVVDSGDPVNHAVDAGTGRGVLFFEIVGDGTPNNPSDLVVPNTVPDSNDTSGTVPAPLAGTEPQLQLMGLTQFNSSTAGADLKVVTKYISGEHGSLLDPTPNPAVTTEIQTQAASFLASDGAVLQVNDPSVLQAPPAP
jgi:pimeloyl-ACP methyl ester carboxylesterase